MHLSVIMYFYHSGKYFTKIFGPMCSIFNNFLLAFNGIWIQEKPAEVSATNGTNIRI